MPTNAINDTGVKYLYDKLHGEIEPVAEAVSDSEVTIEGNPLSFNTLSSQNAKSTILSCEPIQDLHGYDKPWVGGAGKNYVQMTISEIKANNTSGTWNGNAYTYEGITYTLNVDNADNIISIGANGTATETKSLRLFAGNIPNGNYILNGCPSNGGSGKYILWCGFRNASNTGWIFSKTDYGNGESFTKSEDVSYIRLELEISFGITVNNIIYYPMICKSTESSTFAPYTNICPISGCTQIGILGRGKNLFDATNVVNNKRVSGTAGNLWNYNGYCSSAPIEIAPNSVYRKTSGIESYYTFYDKDLRYIGGGAWVDNVTKTSPENAKYLRFDMQMTNKDNVQLEKGNQATPYEPYTKSNDLTISLGQTVYGGTLDVENGVLVVDRAIITEDDFSVVSYNTSGGGLHWSSVTTTNRVIGDGSSISSCLEKKTGSDSWNSTTPCYDDSDTDDIRVYCKSANITDFKTEFSDLQICYELATPITINLTPHTINLLKGVNNISTDGDKITLTYRDGKVATLGDLTSAVDSLDSKIDESKILTDTATGDKYKLVVTNGVLDIQQVSN